MADTGWKYPSNIPYTDLTNPNNVKALDGVYGTSSSGADCYLACDTFGFTIPSDATILGVEVRFTGYLTVENCQDTNPYLQNDGYGDYALNNYYPLGQFLYESGMGSGYITFGGPTNLWGGNTSNMTPALINDSSFGLYFRNIDNAIGGFMYLDAIAIKVYYSQGTDDYTERPASIKGKTTGNVVRSATIKGKTTTNTTRDAKISGKTTDNVLRDAVISGKTTNLVEREASITGKDNKVFYYETVATLKTDDSNPANTMNAPQVAEALDDNNTYVDLDVTNNFAVMQFKFRKNDALPLVIFTWKGRSEIACTTSPIYLQIYNQTTDEWEALQNNSVADANVKITLTANVSGTMSDYLDVDDNILFRVYQEI